MTNRLSYRIGAAHLSVLLLIHALAPLVHACCLMPEHGTESAVVDAIEGHHAGATSGSVTHDPMASHGDHEGGGSCEGFCGLCCESAQDVGAPAHPLTTHVAAHPSAYGAPGSARVDVVLSQPAFLIPFANGPPTRPSIG